MFRFSLILMALLVALPAHAQRRFWVVTDLLQDMFPQSEQVHPLVLELDAAAKAKFTATLGYEPPADVYTVYVATTDGVVDGYVIFDDQLGQHEPITFAVQLTPSAAVVRHEVVVYREKYGDQVRHVRFRRQFEGKTEADAIEAGRDIKIVTGATYSSKSMAVGVRRAVFLAGLLIAED